MIKKERAKEKERERKKRERKCDARRRWTEKQFARKSLLPARAAIVPA